MEKLVIVDGSNLLFQMFYGMPARIGNRDGRPIQGTLGFVGALLRILRMTAPTHAAVLFDGECSNPRKTLDEDYKANRPDYSLLPEEETPFSQLPDIFAPLDCLGIPWAETADCEADDWIAGYARKYGRESQVVIVSQDSDFFQLITDRVRVLRYRGEKTVICDPEYIRAKLGIEPDRYAAYKSLTGDHADNIRGAEHIGPKTAAALMNRFASLEELLAHPEEIARPYIRDAVIRCAPRLRTNYLLIRLTGAEDLPFAPAEMTYRDTGLTTRQVLIQAGVLP